MQSETTTVRAGENHIAYFGYGSLVNLSTLRTPYLSSHRTQVKGWERVWLSRPKVEGSFSPIDGLAFLSVRAAPDSQIDGLMITDHSTSLASLDEREALYTRTSLLTGAMRFYDDIPVVQDSFLYVADAAPAQNDARILRSYLDAVMQGYLTHFGEQGVHDFIATTQNFDLAIEEDRNAPIYPRPVKLSDDERDFFDSLK